MWISAPLLLLVAAVSNAPADLPAQLEGLVKSGPLGHSHAGIEVWNLDNGRVVFSSHARELLNPASNTKIFTGAAAIAKLGSDYRWATEVFVEAPPENGVLKGNLILRGKGDPTLISERMWQMANELWHLGLRQVKGDLVLDDSFFDQVTEGPGWEQEDTDRAYLAPISALACNWGSFGIYVSPGDKAGAPARVEIEPMSPYFKLESQVKTGGRARRIKTSGVVTRDGYRVKVTGFIPPGTPTSTFWRRVANPSRYTGYTFKQILSQRGIKITGRIRRGVKPPGSHLFYSSQSESLDIVLKQLNKHSSNFVAEMLVKTLGAEVRGAPGGWGNGLDAIADFLALDVGIPRGSYVMRNGSGLNDVNRFSADQVVRVLAYIFPRMTLAPEYLSSLPIAAKDGTIRFRMEDTAAAGRVRAKTGTLEDVSALSGYTESLGGGHYAFALLVNDYPSSLRQAIAAEDSFAVALSATGGAVAEVTPAALPEDARARRSRAEGYAKLGQQQDDPSTVSKLLKGLRREVDPAVRAIAVDALYRAEPDDDDSIQALVDDVPDSAAEIDRLLTLAQDLGLQPPLVSALVDLASDGDPRGLRALLGLAATELQAHGLAQQAWEQAIATGLAEVAQQTPRALFEALAAGNRPRALRDVHRLAQGLAANPDATARFAEALSEAAASPKLAGFVQEVKGALAEGKPVTASEGPARSLVNQAVPRIADPIE